MEKEMDGDGMGMGIEMGMEMVGWAPTPFTSAHWEQLCSLVTPHLHFQALLGPHTPPCPVPPHAHLVARPHGLGSAHLHPC